MPNPDLHPPIRTSQQLSSPPNNRRSQDACEKPLSKVTEMKTSKQKSVNLEGTDATELRGNSGKYVISDILGEVTCCLHEIRKGKQTNKQLSPIKNPKQTFPESKK